MKGLLSRRPEIALVGITFLWSSTFIATKDIVRFTPPVAYLTLRFGIAAAVLFLIYPHAIRARRTYRDAIVLGLLQTAGLLFQVLGQVYTTASKSAFVTSFSTALTPMLALALYGERPTRPQAAGVLLASVGLYLLTYPSADADWNRGDLFTLGSAIAYSFIIVETARYTRRNVVPVLATLQTAAAALGFALVLGAAHLAGHLLPPARLPELLALELRPLTISWKLFAYLSYMSLVCTVGTFLGQFWAMARMSATHAAVVFALEPVFATGLAIAVEGGTEWPGMRGAAGAALVLCGVLASEVKRFGPKRID